VQEREERLALMHKPSARRLRTAGITNAWSAWTELWSARTFAFKRLREAANRLRSPDLSDAFLFWSSIAEARRGRREQAESRRRELGLQGEALSLADQLQRAKAEMDARLAMAAADKEEALARQSIELTGSAEQVAEMRAVQEREERLALMHKQSARRLMNAGLLNAWCAWTELWEAKVYALRRLREAANRLTTPELADAFATWTAEIENQRRRAELRAMRQREAILSGEQSDLGQELNCLKEQFARELSALREEKKVALERQLIELTGSADERLALKADQEKEERIELMRRQSTRRMLNAGVAHGWAVWREYVDAKAYAIGRLHAVANRLRAPEKAAAFKVWEQDFIGATHAKEVARLEKESRSVEAQLRRSRFESHQMELKCIAQEEEIKSLYDKLAGVTGHVGNSSLDRAAISRLRMDHDDLQQAHSAAVKTAAEQERLRREAEDDAEAQRVENKKLLERLLAEQRRKLEDTSTRMLRDELSTEREHKERLQVDLGTAREEARVAKSELSKLQAASASAQRHLKGELDKVTREAEAAQADLKEQTRQLEDEVSRLTTKIKSPPTIRTDNPLNLNIPDARKRGSVLGKFDLDEQPGAPPISSQLANALRQDAKRVLDLFRDWDTDGDGEISRKEFHKAMVTLGLEVPTESIDELFSQWDRDGGGSIDYKELQKILKPAPSDTSKTPSKLRALAAASKAAKMLQ